MKGVHGLKPRYGPLVARVAPKPLQANRGTTLPRRHADDHRPGKGLRDMEQSLGTPSLSDMILSTKTTVAHR